MDTFLVLTIIGDDHPGLVEQVADAVADHGGNWLESRMSLLAGKFAGLVRVSVPVEKAEALTQALGKLEERGLRVMVELGGGGETAGVLTMVVLDLVGTDQPGIVRDISRALHQQGVNIEELNTEYSAAPMSGEPLFHARARLHLPPGMTVDGLRQELEQVAESLMVDLQLGESDRD